MKRLTLIITALVLVMGMAQCKKNDNTAASDEGKGVFVSLTAGLDDGAKTEILPSGLVNWSTGDKLYVVGATDGYLGSLTTEADGSPTATFEGYINDITATQDIHFYYVGKKTFPETENTYTYSIATQDGTLGGIADNLHLTHGVLNDVAAIVTELGDINMHNMMSIAKFDISGYDSPATCNAIASRTLDLKSGTWTAEGTTGDIILGNPTAAYYMALIPSATSQTFTFKQNGSDTHPIAKSRLIEAGRMYTNGGKAIVVKEADWLPGLFSVSEGKQVRFSKGNLRYYDSNNDGTCEFMFEGKQWEYRKSYGTTDCGHFLWSKDKSIAVAKSYSDPGAAVGDVFFTNNEQTTPNPEFHVNGETGVNAWRVLSNKEWQYLLGIDGVDSYRDDAEDLYDYKTLSDGNGNDVKGLVILPDGTDKNVIDGISTTSELSDYDAVFIPDAGNRTTGTIQAPMGYWTSTCSTTDKDRAINLRKNNNAIEATFNGRRSFGNAVRLVQDVPNTDGIITIGETGSDGL